MSEGTQRRLAAIVSADVVGYSRLMGTDESGTLAALRAHREELIDPNVAKHGGRLVKTMGDGLLLEFPSVVNATQCAIKIQLGMTERNEAIDANQRITFRIGVNLGDIIIDGEDILGDGVNVAARLQEIAEPGGVAISRRVHEDVQDRLDIRFEDKGERALKNIARPIHVWFWSPLSEYVSTHGLLGEDFPPLPDKPSIAVLPFENMSGDPEQEYFVDGVVEDILTTLSKIPQLFVIARNSSFKYKGQSPDLRDVGRELGVRYVVEGSVRKAGRRVRVTAQLVDCLSGQHVWAEHYDGDLDDVFALQDRLTEEIVTGLEVKLTDGEMAAFWRKRSGNPMVFEKFSKGRELYTNFAKQTHSQARSEFEAALAINPNYAPALFSLGLTLVDQARFGWVSDRDAAYEAALSIADHAIANDPDYGVLYTVISYARTFQRRFDEALEAAEKAVAISPNNAAAFHMAAMTYIYAGDFQTGRNYELQYSRLSPISREVAIVDLARAEYHLAAFEEARKLTRQVLQGRPRWLTAKTILLASLWRLGREEEAKKIASDIKTDHPNFSVLRWSKGWPYRREDDLQELMDPLRLAGLPD